MPRATPASSLPPVPLGGGGFGPMSGMVPFLWTNLASAAQKARVNPNPAAHPKVPTPALATPEGIMQAANMASFKALLSGLSASRTPSLVFTKRAETVTQSAAGTQASTESIS